MPVRRGCSCRRCGSSIATIVVVPVITIRACRGRGWRGIIIVPVIAIAIIVIPIVAAVVPIVCATIIAIRGYGRGDDSGGGDDAVAIGGQCDGVLDVEQTNAVQTARAHGSVEAIGQEGKERVGSRASIG